MSNSVYLGCLDSSGTMEVSGVNSYIIPDLPSYDSSLTYGAPYSDMSNVWLFRSDNVLDTSSILIKSNQTFNFIGDTSSSSDASSFTNLYQPDPNDFLAHVVVDLIDGSGQPEAAEDFIDNVAFKALGTGDADFAFSQNSINDLLAEYGHTVERACKSVNDNFLTNTSFSTLADVTKQNDKAGKLVYQWLKTKHGHRFQLDYSMNSDTLPAPGSPAYDFSDISVNFTGALTPATVDGTLDPSGILNALKVKTTGSGYTHGLDVSFTIIDTNQTSYDFSGTLNSVGAAQLNGTLNDNSGVQYPLEVGDEFDILLTIHSHPDQLDGFGNSLSSERTTLLKMRLTE
jgi:hypothetical protein